MLDHSFEKVICCSLCWYDALCFTKVSLIWGVETGLGDLSFDTADDGGSSNADHGRAVGGGDHTMVDGGGSKAIKETAIGADAL